MRLSRIVIAGILVVAGLAWIAQGTGILEGSAMSGSSFWAIVGVILVVAGGLIGVREFNRRPTAHQ